MLRVVKIFDIDGKQHVGLQGQTNAEVLRDHEKFREERDKRAAAILLKRFGNENNG
jgi:hypothetical protein